MPFLIDIFAGILVAFCYDFFRTFRHKIKNGKINAISDVFFWICTGIVILTALFYNSDMELRAYEFFGFLTGIFFYFGALSSVLQPIHLAITQFFQLFWKILFTIGKYFVIIIKNVFLFLSAPFRLLSRWGKAFLEKRKASFQKQKKLMKRI